MQSTCIITAEGKFWYYQEDQVDFRDILHREDGPAIEWNNKHSSYYLHGIRQTPEMMPLNLFLIYCKWQYKKNGK